MQHYKGAAACARSCSPIVSGREPSRARCPVNFMYGGCARFERSVEPKGVRSGRDWRETSGARHNSSGMTARGESMLRWMKSERSDHPLDNKDPSGALLEQISGKDPIPALEQICAHLDAI